MKAPDSAKLYALADEVQESVWLVACKLRECADALLKHELERSNAEAASRKPPTVQWVPDPETET